MATPGREPGLDGRAQVIPPIPKIDVENAFGRYGTELDIETYRSDLFVPVDLMSALKAKPLSKLTVV
jgi:hypothetical protein